MRKIHLVLPEEFYNVRVVFYKDPEADDWHVFDDLCRYTFVHGGKVKIILNGNDGSEKRSGVFANKDEIKITLNLWKKNLQSGDYFVLDAMNLKEVMVKL